MASQLHQDPTTHLTPAQNAALRNATAPIGTAKDARAELDRLEAQTSTLQTTIQQAGRVYADETRLPESTPDDVREAVQREAEIVIAEVETAARRDLALLHARARSIVAQLDRAASQPSPANIPDALLDRANRLEPVIRNGMAGASLDQIAERLAAARMRDDQAELLAMNMALSPILAAREASPDQAGDDASYQLFDLRGQLRQIMEKWVDVPTTSARIHAETVARKLTDLDTKILHGYQERTGDPDPFGFLSGL